MKKSKNFWKVAAIGSLALMLTFPTLSAANSFKDKGEGKWMSGDFHQHTTYTDGSYPFAFMAQKNNEFGLDWWSNSEHGGQDPRDGQGNNWTTYNPNPIVDNTTNMWRWQSLRSYAYPDILGARATYPGMRIVSGLEWNVPGHEHCSVSVIPRPEDNTANAVAAFEYQFDKSDGDTLQNGKYFGPFGPLYKDNATYSHQAAIDAVGWMQYQYNANNIDNAWIIFAHIERAGAWIPATGHGGYNVDTFRDFNNAAPDICFGFEGVPGHQAGTNRGEFSSGASGGGTYGGAGIYTARTGGLWDALLGEGRRWFNFASSDCHTHWDAGGSDYYPGEYQKTWTYMVDEDGDGEISLNEIAKGLPFR